MLAIRGNAVELRVEQTFDRALPPRKGWWAKTVERLRPAAPAPAVRTFEVTPQPVATDAHTHPVFVRLAGELPIHQVRVGDRVFVVGAMFVCLLRDDPPTRARVVAAYDRTADLAWAAASPVDALHLGLLDRLRADAAMRELRSRRALDAAGLAARVPAERIGALQGVLGLLGPDERRAFFAGAAPELGRTGDRVALVALANATFDFAPFAELEPLVLLLDPARPEEERPVAFARARLAMILREEPARAGELARLSAHLDGRSPC